MNPDRRLKIVSFSPFALWRLHSLYEVAICHNLKSRGYEYLYVTCDGLFSECDMFWESTSGPRPKNACEICQVQVKRSLTELGIKPVVLGQYGFSDFRAIAKRFIEHINDNQLLEVCFEGFPISKCVVSSVYSHLRVNRINLEDKKHCSVLRGYVYSGIIAFILIRRMLKIEKPSIVLLFNGRMATLRIALELCKEFGIRVVCHERGLVSEFLLLWENESCLSLRPYRELSYRWRDIPLTRIEFGKTARWLVERRNGKNLSWKEFSTVGSLGSAADFIKKFADRKLIGLFTSSTDEIIADEEFKSVFGTQQSWVEHNINIARSDASVALIIRVHPNSGSKSSTGFNHDEINLFKKLGKNLPDNVIIIHADALCSSYALFDYIAVGVVFASTISLELACKGIPVICAASSPWVYCDAIDTVSATSDYHDLLIRLIKFGMSMDKRRARVRAAMRFTYAYIFRWNIEFPLVSMPDIHNGVLNCNSSDDLKLGKYRCLDYCVDILLGIRDSVPSPLYPINRLKIDEETVALEEYCEDIQAMVPETYPLISIVIPCYNYGLYLRECVLSVVSQSFVDIEILIVNDGSTDNSGEVIESCIKEFSKTKIIVVDQDNSGQPAISRNNGIKKAKGEWILPLDADDKLGDEMLSDCVKIIRRHSELAVVYTDFAYLYPDNSQRIQPTGQFHQIS